MARSKSSNTSAVDIPDLMKVICGFRAEAFPFERYVALLTFGTWLHASEQPDVVRQARLIAAGLLMTAIHSGRLAVPPSERHATINAITSNAFHPLDAADALVNYLIVGTFQEVFEQDRALGDAAAVAAFIIRCLLEMRPSVNKALFFIDEGGLTGDAFNVGEEDRNERYTVSPATIKKGWAWAARASPFWGAADYLKVYSIGELPPDDGASISKASDLLGDIPRIRQYFGTARSIQELLVDRLGERSRDRYHFVHFPSSIILHSYEPRPFRTAQLDFIKRYRAPKFLSDHPSPTNVKSR
jgi:hypothetical protein